MITTHEFEMINENGDVLIGRCRYDTIPALDLFNTVIIVSPKGGEDIIFKVDHLGTERDSNEIDDLIEWSAAVRDAIDRDNQ
jgi:hypothetical protein